jgi:hypothetical protein
VAQGADLGVLARLLVGSSRSIASALVTPGTPVAGARPGIIAQLPAVIRCRLERCERQDSFVVIKMAATSADGNIGTRRVEAAGDPSVASGDQIAVPAEHGFWAHEQPDPAEHVAGEPVQQSGEEGPIRRGKPHSFALQLSLEDRDLVAEGEDLGVFGPVAHRQQPQHRERVGHAEVGQSQ